MIARKTNLIGGFGRMLVLPFAGLLIVGGCTAVDEPGTSLAVSTTHHASSEEGAPVHHGAGPRRFITAEGLEITLESAWVVIESVELVRCETSMFRRVVPELFGISTAYAHVDSSPTKLGEPMALNMLSADGEPRVFGHLEPPPGEYCAVRVGIAPADRDTRDLPSPELVGQSFRVRGHYGDDDTPFVISSSNPGELRLDLGLNGPGLSLRTGEPMHAVIAWVYDRWFDGIDFESSLGSRQHTVDRNIGLSMAVSASEAVESLDGGVRDAASDDG